MVVLPALSRPRMRTRISLVPKSEVKMDESMRPMTGAVCGVGWSGWCWVCGGLGSGVVLGEGRVWK